MSAQNLFILLCRRPIFRQKCSQPLPIGICQIVGNCFCLLPPYTNEPVLDFYRCINISPGLFGDRKYSEDGIFAILFRILACEDLEIDDEILDYLKTVNNYFEKPARKPKRNQNFRCQRSHRSQWITWMYVHGSSDCRKYKASISARLPNSNRTEACTMDNTNRIESRPKEH